MPNPKDYLPDDVTYVRGHVRRKRGQRRSDGLDFMRMLFLLGLVAIAILIVVKLWYVFLSLVVVYLFLFFFLRYKRHKWPFNP